MRAAFFGFLAAVVVIDGLLHYYLWARLVRDPAWSAGPTRALTALVIVFAVGLPLGMVLARTAPRAIGEPLAIGAYVWMGTVFILVSLVFITDLVRWTVTAVVALQSKLGGPSDPVRRELLTRGAALAAGGGAAVLSAAAVRSGLAEVEVREVPVRLPRLPPALSGLSVVQLSDVHVGPLIGERFVETIVSRANRLRPDAVVITGDLVDGSVESLRRHTEALGRLKARFGVFFVTGNHEYYSGVDPWLSELTRLGIRVLRNERVSLGDAGASIDLAGVDDYTADRFGGGHGADLSKAVAGRDPERELILLAHQPRAIEAAGQAGVGLQLSGHTHGGQIWPFGHAVRLVQPYIAGLHAHNPGTQIYVSRGTGFWGPPMRLWAPAEITKLILT
jgi:hypothetical protein